jgi:hypothetical protein
LVVVSQNSSLYININGPIDCKLLCSKIGGYIDNYNKNFGINKDRILEISIKEITHTTNEHIKKLEKND